MNTTLSKLRIFTQATTIPLFLYSDSVHKQINSPDLEFPTALIDSLLSYSLGRTRLSVYIENYFWAIFTLPDETRVLMGPLSHYPASAQGIQGFLEKYLAFNTQNLTILADYFKYVPLIPMSQFLESVRLLYELLFYEPLSKKELESSIVQNEPINLNQIQQNVAENSYLAKETEYLHNTYRFEQELYQLVATGNLKGLQNFFAKAPTLIKGHIGNTSLRQEQNIFISSITLLTRASIAGGLDIETAYQLSDTYIQTSEKTNSIHAIEQLSTTAIFDFAKKVEAVQLPKNLSPIILEVIHFIRNRTNHNLRIEDIASHVHLSRSHLSRLFKKEVGVTILDFINESKIEEACLLLRNTNKPLSEISDFLGFSSQSYFQNVFKAYRGITPRTYRQTNNR
ncbi:helix-turn-helix transcriptional regulator [Granulicatella adiacens]